MKQTVFQFRLRITADQPDERLRLVADKLKSIVGVDNAEGDLSESFVAFRVHASFIDAEAAMKLHRKIMTALMKMDGVVITQTTSEPRCISLFRFRDCERVTGNNPGPTRCFQKTKAESGRDGRSHKMIQAFLRDV
jgi:hypothetical protein